MKNNSSLRGGVVPISQILFCGLGLRAWHLSDVIQNFMHQGHALSTVLKL
jgi:hypothetical protein